MEIDITVDYVGFCNDLISEFCKESDRELVSELLRKNIVAG